MLRFFFKKYIITVSAAHPNYVSKGSFLWPLMTPMHSFSGSFGYLEEGILKQRLTNVSSVSFYLIQSFQLGDKMKRGLYFADYLISFVFPGCYIKR